LRRLFRTGFGRLTAPQLTEIGAAGQFLRQHQEPLAKIADRFSEAAPPAAWILAEITGHTAIAGANGRWEYSFQQVYIDGNLNLSNGLWTSTNTAKALNLCELVNDGALIEGPGWNVNTAPSGFEIKPIDECVVQLWPHRLTTGAFRWVFFASNVLDGECPEAP
jgi:hypothetical protein